MELKDRIISYIVRGFPMQEIPSLVGCTRGYLSQLRSAPDFQHRLSEAMNGAPAETISTEVTDAPDPEKVLEDKLLMLEFKALQAMENNIEAADLPIQLKAYQAIADRRDKMRTLEQRKAAALSFPGSSAPVVHLHLPQPVIPSLTISPTNAILGLGERSLLPMDVAQVRALVEENSDE